MRMAVHPVQNRRRATRNNVRHTVRWNHKDGEDQTGEILDISSSGVFLTPLGMKLDQLQLNDPVCMIVAIEEEEHTLSAKVCWVGKSSEHEEAGVGLEFDRDSQAIANKHRLCSVLNRRL
ncbi:MAG: PilZ domain-containing protein [Proteobacteria bacterium]|nr:PilZ domain-containing protein [Pseudomonadota bacterium]